MIRTQPRLTVGAVGLAAALRSDFVKVNYPKKDGVESADARKETVVIAGRTKVVCAGGERCDVKTFLQRLYDQIHLGGRQAMPLAETFTRSPLRRL